MATVGNILVARDALANTYAMDLLASEECGKKETIDGETRRLRSGATDSRLLDCRYMFLRTFSCVISGSEM